MARCELRCRWVDLNPIEYTRRCERRARDLFRRCDDRERIRRSLVRLAEGRDRRWGLSRPRRRAEITGWSGPAQDAVIGIRNLSSAVTRFAGNTLTDPLVSERKVITGVIDGRVIQTGPDRPQNLACTLLRMTPRTPMRRARSRLSKGGDFPPAVIARGLRSSWSMRPSMSPKSRICIRKHHRRML
jgi:hypothetical protein